MYVHVFAVQWWLVVGVCFRVVFFHSQPRVGHVLPDLHGPLSVSCFGKGWFIPSEAVE
jgi:hypothetical protein